MQSTETAHEWSRYLSVFSEMNKGKKTRLGVFENNVGVINDYWLECGLPLSDIDIDVKNDPPAIRISAGLMTHVVDNAVKIELHLDLNGDEDGLDIRNAAGITTILRFEDERTLP